MVDYYGGMGFGKSDMNIAVGAAAGGLVGAVQTVLLRQFADIPMATAFLKNTSGSPPLLMKQLKGFGSVSALAGMIGGAVGLIIGLAGMLKGKIIRSRGGAAALTAYGLTALTSGLLSGAFPATAWSAGIAADPNNPVAAPSIVRIQPGTNNSGQIVRAPATGVTLGA